MSFLKKVLRHSSRHPMSTIRCFPASTEPASTRLATDPKPAMVRSYNVHMSGVDCVDQQLHRIQALRKSYKWQKKLIFRLLLQVSLNLHKVYQKCTVSNMVFLDYLTINIKQMIARTPPIPPAINYAITGRHFPILISLIPGTTSRLHKRC